MSKVVKSQLTPKRSASFAVIIIAAIGVSFAGGIGFHYLMNDARVTEAAAKIVKPLAAYGRCSGSVRIRCVVDGDTLWNNGVKLRIADIDAPEVSEPKCASEKALGDRATARLIELVNEGPFDLLPLGNRDEDRYGRKLRVLVRAGRSLGDILVSEGLARTWTGRREPWC